MPALNLSPVEIKAFVPAVDYARSKDFYTAIGFICASDEGDVAYFHRGECAFLLQNFNVPAHTANFMMHLLVENVDDWHRHLADERIAERFGVRIGPLEDQPWGMRDFALFDPSGVLWRIAMNTPRPPSAP